MLARKRTRVHVVPRSGAISAYSPLPKLRRMLSARGRGSQISRVNRILLEKIEWFRFRDKAWDMREPFIEFSEIVDAFWRQGQSIAVLIKDLNNWSAQYEDQQQGKFADSTSEMFQIPFHLNMLDFRAIAERYNQFVKPGNDEARISTRAWSGYYYDGFGANSTVSKLFIKIIQRLALADGSVIGPIDKYLNGESTEKSAKEADENVAVVAARIEGLVDKLHEAFRVVADSYTGQLAAQVDAWFGQLGKQYGGEAFQYAREYPNDGSVANGHNALVPDHYKIGNEIAAMIRHNVDQEKERIQQDIEGFQTELAKLADDINLFAEQFNICKRLLKTEDEDAKKYLGFKLKTVPHSLVDTAEQKRRRWTYFAGGIAMTTGWLLGCGEGVVAGVGAAGFFAIPVLPIALGIIVAMCGWFCNYYLVKDDSRSTLEKIFLGKLFTRKDGTKVIGVEKVLTILFGIIFSAASAFCMAALSQQSQFLLLQAILPSFLALSLSFIGPIFTFIGMFSIFFVVISDFIKERRMKGIASYFLSTYFCSGDSRIWHGMSTGEKFFHIFVRSPINLIKLGVGVTSMVFLAFITFGLFYQEGVGLLNAIVRARCIPIVVKVISALYTWLNFVFCINSVSNVIHSADAKKALALPFTLATTYPVHILGVVLESFILRPLVGTLAFFWRTISRRSNLGKNMEYTPQITTRITSWLDRFWVETFAGGICDSKAVRDFRRAVDRPYNKYVKYDGVPPAEADSSKLNPLQKKEKQYLDMHRGTIRPAIILNASGQAGLRVTSVEAIRCVPLPATVAKGITVPSTMLGSAGPNTCGYDKTMNGEKVPAAHHSGGQTDLSLLGLFRVPGVAGEQRAKVENAVVITR